MAPIALYPDTLLSQILAASTYPIEVVEAQQWLQQHRDLKGQALMNEAQKQNWDPSVQALVAFPDVLDPAESGHSLDHRSRQRISRATGRRDECRATAARESAGQRQVAIDTARERDHPNAKRADRDRYRASRSWAWSTFLFTIPNGFGVRRFSATIRRSFIPASAWDFRSCRDRSRLLFWRRLGAVGRLWMGMGPRLVWRPDPA